MPTPSDPALRDLLRRADPAADLPAADPAAFAAAVHIRIQSADTSNVVAFPGAFTRQFFPLAAALAILASIGAGSAVAYARERDARAETFAAAYARSIDPWQMHNATTTAHHHTQP